MEADMKTWMYLLFGGSHRLGDRQIELYEFCIPSEITFRRLAQVFEDCSNLLAPYSDETLNRAFWDLSSVWYALGDDSIPEDLRRRVINSFVTLFRELFAKRCSPVLGERSEQGSPLNSACYMWWDFDCWYSIPGTELVEAMRSILAINHAACQESALHGLGHWLHRQQAAAVERIVDEFLKREADLRPELRKYAQAVRIGCVQ